LTDDLVKRLRDLVNDDDTEMLAWQAADRIEKLETALREIACVCYKGCGGPHAQCRARAALGEKKDEEDGTHA
jgi:hypothetical protein